MNPQLESLIMLQDLDLMIHEMTDQNTANQMTRIGFELNQVQDLHDARDDLEKKIDTDLLAIYKRLMKRYQRAIAPVRNNVCLACFIKQPTKYIAGDPTIRWCNNCNRFLYFI